MEIPCKMDAGSKMEFTYKKDDNRKLFKSLEENSAFGILEPQNYIPLYNSYFSLTKTNSNAIMLNHKWKIQEILAEEATNIYKCQLKDTTIETKDKKKDKVFLKFSPLLDPIKYLLGKYDTTDATLLNLPAFESTECHSKTREYNNSAYVDSFFTYLSSKLLHDHGFVHGMDFYGSFLALKTDFRINIVDDIESDGEHGDADEDELYDDYEDEDDIDREFDDPDRARKYMNIAKFILAEQIQSNKKAA